jgi:hypothetical protein
MDLMAAAIINIRNALPEDKGLWRDRIGPPINDKYFRD